MPGDDALEETNVPLLGDLASTVPSQDHSDQALTRKFWTESKKLWHIVGPTIFKRVSSYSLMVITQAFAGHLGDLELAAISIANNVVITLNYGLLLGMASALETLCGQSFGAKSYYMLRVYMQRSWIVLSICCVLLLPLYLYASPVLKLLGQPDDVAELSGMVSIWLIPLHFSFAFQFPLQTFLQWVRVSNELGAGNGKGAKFATIVSVVTSMAIGLFFFILVLIFHSELALAFSSSEAVLQIVNKMSILLALTILLNSVQPVLSGVAVGSGWQSYVAYINLGCYYIIGVPLGFMMGRVFYQGVEGIWAGMIFGGTVVQTLILAIITMRCDWNKEAKKASTAMRSMT